MVKFCGILWDNGGSCETWRGWFQREKTRGGRGGWGGEERENGSGSDEEDGDRSGRHGGGRITKIGRKEERNGGSMKQW